MKSYKSIHTVLVLLLLLFVGVGECWAENYTFTSNLSNGAVTYNTKIYEDRSVGVTIDCTSPTEGNFTIVPISGYNAKLTIDNSAKTIRLVYTLVPGVYTIKATWGNGVQYPFFNNNGTMRCGNATTEGDATLFIIMPDGNTYSHMNQPTYKIASAVDRKEITAGSSLASSGTSSVILCNTSNGVTWNSNSTSAAEGLFAIGRVSGNDVYSFTVNNANADLNRYTRYYSNYFYDYPNAPGGYTTVNAITRQNDYRIYRVSVDGDVSASISSSSSVTKSSATGTGLFVFDRVPDRSDFYVGGVMAGGITVSAEPAADGCYTVTLTKGSTTLETGIYKLAASIDDRGYLIDKGDNYFTVGSNRYTTSQDANDANSLWYVRKMRDGRYTISSLNTSHTGIAFLKGVGNGDSYDVDPVAAQSWEIEYMGPSSRYSTTRYGSTPATPPYYQLKRTAESTFLGATSGYGNEAERLHLIGTERAATYWEFQSVEESAITDATQQELLSSTKNCYWTFKFEDAGHNTIEGVTISCYDAQGNVTLIDANSEYLNFAGDFNLSRFASNDYVITNLSHDEANHIVTFTLALPEWYTVEHTNSGVAKKYLCADEDKTVNYTEEISDRYNHIWKFENRTLTAGKVNFVSARFGNGYVMTAGTTAGQAKLYDLGLEQNPDGWYNAFTMTDNADMKRFGVDGSKWFGVSNDGKPIVNSTATDFTLRRVPRMGTAVHVVVKDENDNPLTSSVSFTSQYDPLETLGESGILLTNGMDYNFHNMPFVKTMFTPSNGDVSIENVAFDEEHQTLTFTLKEKKWTVHITGVTGDYKVVYNTNQYSNGQQFVASELSPSDLSITCTDKFVWGPIIDDEARTITYDIRSLAETLEAGRFYQIQILDRRGKATGNTWYDNYYQTLNGMSTIRKRSNTLYLMNYPSLTMNTYPTDISGIPVPNDDIYWSYVFIESVDAGGNIAWQLPSGNYVSSTGESKSVKSLNFSLKNTDGSFAWNGGIMPWNNLGDNGHKHVALGYTSSGEQANTFHTFIHKVNTGEDYDIYKITNTQGTVTYLGTEDSHYFRAGSNWYLLLPKNSAPPTAADFLINQAEASSVTINLENGINNLTVVEYHEPLVDITSLSQINKQHGHYRLMADITAFGESIVFPGADNSFHGVLDGNHHKITGVSHALFDRLTNATVKNLTIENVYIHGTTVGTVANVATGNSRVYNCGVTSGTVNGSAEAGSIVGRLEGNARVVNCYSYADVSGGTVAGIVGNNAGTSATQGTVFNGGGTLVMNCAYFGKLSGTNVYPVFGGNDINNDGGVNTYNYYIHDAALSYASPNSAQGTEETSYFNRFDFYRSILNSHKQLAAMYIFGTEDITEEQLDEIAHWKYDSNVAEFLSQEPWPKNTRHTLDRTIPTTYEAYKGKKVGEVSATFIINGHNENVTLPLTDMDTDRWDYTYGKVVLPFANEFSGWSLPESGSAAYDNIITGWEVTSITGGTPGTYADHDLCDPDCTAKDLYSNSGYVWAQGGNFVVPKGVTAITFTAHVGRAVYLRDTHPDIAYNSTYTVRTNLGSQINGTYNGKNVYNSIDAAFAQLTDKTNPADQAIVLVGNYHLNKEFVQSTGTTTHAAKAVTFMSIDADNNQEPDYCLYQFNTQGSGRVSMPPVRFDFVTSPGFAMASYTKGGLLAGIGIIHSKGWFETTETATLKMTEFEMRPDYYSQASPVILNGGEFSRILMTSTNEYGTSTDKLLYTKIGGRAYVETLNLGRTSSVPASSVISLSPLNVSGGEIVNCHLTGFIHDGATSGDARFYCNGGYIHEFNGAYLEKLNGDMIARMDHALIDEFYGGGADDAYGAEAQITGDINITCNNSYIKFFCGGPKFGNMASGKTVTVTADGSTFDEYYGASYGGTALTAFEKAHQGTTFSGNQNITFALGWNNYTSERLIYNSARRGIGVDFDLDFFQYAGGGKSEGNQSFYVNFASLSLAKTGSVTSTMTNCTFNSHFFGGGCRGMVAGDVTSTLTDCIVRGNAYGGGYTPKATECMVYPETQPTYPVYKGLYGLFTKYVRTAEPVAYHWAQAGDGHAAGTVDEANKLLYTDVNMSQMGEITGNTSLTIKGTNTVIDGDVFGGGAESKVIGSTTVVIGEQQSEQDPPGDTPNPLEIKKLDNVISDGNKIL